MFPVEHGTAFPEPTLTEVPHIHRWLRPFNSETVAYLLIALDNNASYTDQLMRESVATHLGLNLARNPLKGDFTDHCQRRLVPAGFMEPKQSGKLTAYVKTEVGATIGTALAGSLLTLAQDTQTALSAWVGNIQLFTTTKPHQYEMQLLPRPLIYAALLARPRTLMELSQVTGIDYQQIIYNLKQLEAAPAKPIKYALTQTMVLPALQFVELVQAFSNPTAEIIQTGLEQAQTILNNPQLGKQLIQQAENSNPAYQRLKHEQLEGYILQLLNESDGGLSITELADSLRGSFHVEKQINYIAYVLRNLALREKVRKEGEHDKLRYFPKK